MHGATTLSELLITRRETPSFFAAVQSVTLVIYLLIGLAPLASPASFNWIPERDTWLLVWLALFGTTLALTFCLVTLKKDIFFVSANYLQAIFYLVIIYLTGGVSSPLIILLVAPLLLSALYLDAKETGTFGLLIGFVFILFFIPDPAGAGMTQYATTVVLYAGIVVLVYELTRLRLHLHSEIGTLKEQLAKQMDLDHTKSMFVDVTAHQLRTPLSAVRWGLGQLMHDDELPEDRRYLAQRSHERAEAAIDVVDRILEAAELTTKDLGNALIKKRMNATETIRGIIEELSYLQDEQNVTVHCRACDEGTPLYVSADPRLLRTAITNVIDNAIRYSPGGSVTIDITTEGNDTKIVVTDTGSGVSEEDQKHIFERLYRGSNGTYISPGQSGVGLYTTRKVIEELHGGSIELESTEGEGTTVTICLPRSSEKCD